MKNTNDKDTGAPVAEKRSLPKRCLLFLKWLIHKLFGKARWILIPFVIILTLLIGLSFFPSLTPYLDGTRDDDGFVIHETKLDKGNVFRFVRK